MFLWSFNHHRQGFVAGTVEDDRSVIQRIQSRRTKNSRRQLFLISSSKCSLCSRIFLKSFNRGLDFVAVTVADKEPCKIKDCFYFIHNGRKSSNEEFSERQMFLVRLCRCSYCCCVFLRSFNIRDWSWTLLMNRANDEECFNRFQQCKVIQKSPWSCRMFLLSFNPR